MRNKELDFLFMCVECLIDVVCLSTVEITFERSRYRAKSGCAGVVVEIDGC